MGRVLKRVALDFDWPLTKVWSGYKNPHYVPCKVCGGRGDTIAARRLQDLVGLLLLSGSDAAQGKCHPYFFECGGLHGSHGAVCADDMVELTTALAGRAPSCFGGHDACDSSSAFRKIIKAAKLPKDWGTCRACDGDGVDREHQAAYKAWRKSEPPKGDGFQIWETVSEGAPISPVFPTAEELARYMAGRPHGADAGSSYHQWLAFINGPGWAPSAVITQGVMLTGPIVVPGASMRPRKPDKERT